VNSPKPFRAGRRIRRAILGVLLGVWIASAIWQAEKPLPAGMGVAMPLRQGDDVRFLSDRTWVDSQGQRHVQQQIFDRMLQLIGGAQRFIVADLFLFNDYVGAEAHIQRPLSEELTAALIARKQADPDLQVVLITDPINTVYGGQVSPQLERLRAAGMQVGITDLSQLPASNPAWTGLWMLCCRWLGNDAHGGWLPNALGHDPVTLRSYLSLLNFRANHRKTLIVDDGRADGGGDGDGWAGMVMSMNPHDASSAHDNVALEVHGAAALDLLQSERAVPLQSPVAWPAQPVLAQENHGTGVQILTENAIRDALLDTVASAQPGDSLDISVFYFSERALVQALLAAQQRGVKLRVLLDPNEDAFGRKKNGVPNRQVGAELHDSGVPVRWCDTHGEQCHTKMLLLTRSDGIGELIVGSANYTRRNLDGFNGETSARLIEPLDHPALVDARAYFDQVWSNTPERHFSTDFARFEDHAWWRRLYYRFGEASGLSTW